MALKATFPQQDMSNIWATKWLAVSLHFGMLVHHIAAIMGLATLNLNSLRNTHYEVLEHAMCHFLTIWNTIIQIVYLCFVLTIDMLDYCKGEYQLKNTLSVIRGYVFTALLFPYSVLIPLIFWGIASIDIDLIVPSSVFQLLPTWINHALHTNTIFVSALELLVDPPRLPRYVVSFLFTTAFIVLYFFRLMMTYSKYGFWIYGFLNKFDQLEMGIFFGAVYFLILALHHLGFHLLQLSSVR